MNYLEMIVSFQRWKEVNPLPASAISLWHELLAVCNRAGWPEEFTVPNPVIQANAGLSRKEFDRARQILIDAGLIQYEKSSQVNHAGKYSINSLSGQKVHQKEQQKEQQEEHRKGQQKGHQEEHQTGHERDTVRGALNNKHKLKQKQYTSDFEQFWETYPRKVGKQRAFESWNARTREGENPLVLIRCAQNYAENCRNKKTETQYIKHPSTFLSAKRDYEDYTAKIEPRPHVVNGRSEVVRVTDEEVRWLDEIARKQRERNQAAQSS